VSTKNLINRSNVSTEEMYLVNVRKLSMDLLKKHRFDFNVDVCFKTQFKLLSLGSLVCKPPCYITEEDKDKIRELVINKSIHSFYEL
jgi:hypothetical protein